MHGKSKMHGTLRAWMVKHSNPIEHHHVPPSIQHLQFRDLSRPFAWHLLRQLGQRLHLLACPKDMWLPDHHFQEVLMQVPDIQVRISFICEESQVCKATSSRRGSAISAFHS